MNYCDKFNAILIHDRFGDVLITRTRCRQWTCAYCAGINRKIWQAKIINGINVTGGLWSWFTLTAHSKARTAIASLKNIRAAWSKLRKRLKRRFGKFAYVRVLERHKDGAYHLHCIANFHFGDIVTRKSKSGDETNYSKWLAVVSKELGLGYYTHADDIDVQHHAGYIASYIVKYVVKMTSDMKSEVGRTRHIQTSLRWTKLVSEDDGKWEMKAGIYLSEVIKLEASGGRFIDIQTGEIITKNNFIGAHIYPHATDKKD